MVWIVVLILQLLSSLGAGAVHPLTAPSIPKAQSAVKCKPPSGQPPGIPLPIETPAPAPSPPPDTVPPLCS